MRREDSCISVCMYVCTCVQENGTPDGNELPSDPRCGSKCARCPSAQMGPHRSGGRRRPAGEPHIGKLLVPVFLLQKSAMPRRRSSPGGVLRARRPPPPPPRRPSRLTAQLPARPERGEAKAAGLGAGGGGRLGSPAAKLSARPAAAARVAPRAEPCCAAGQSLRGRGGAPRPDRPWERGGTRRRLGGNHRGNPAEDAPRTKMCLQWRAPAPRAAAARGSGAPAAVCASEEREELPARPRSAQKVEKNMD